MPQGDQVDDYTVFLYCYTLILYCAWSTWIRALFDNKSNLHFLNICLCNALPQNCLILSSLVFFLEPGCYNNIHTRVLSFWYKYLTFFWSLFLWGIMMRRTKTLRVLWLMKWGENLGKRNGPKQRKKVSFKILEFGTVKPRLTATLVIQSPCYYGHFFARQKPP